MIILGLLLLLGAAGLSIAAIVANQDAFAASAGTLELFGYSAQLTIGEVFLIGTGAGVVGLIGLLMLFSGMGRSARRRSATRRELAAQRAEMRELQRKNELAESSLESQRTADVRDPDLDRDEVRSAR
ncbi:hypothetical protein F4553_002307 [Allocatelliglobosispora scoriae]|uniref:LapA family protein n=1 Tax=Allocatelliglobosispora scoriae TaxID=643052 RepID=A0A841BNG6_9ACTN|nr:hypothetical protein [Allocatelliglobosispora scoriae]MBB5868928.1 hypothetical protein [Allocatelliglobosispora scoriae]